MVCSSTDLIQVRTAFTLSRKNSRCCFGRGTEERQFTPLPVSWPGSPQQVASISAGAVASAAVTRDGALWTFGAGGYGVLGHGDTETSLVPRRVEALVDRVVVSVSIGAGVAGAQTSSPAPGAASDWAARWVV